MALADWLAVEVSIPRIYSIRDGEHRVREGETGANRRYGVVTVTFRKVASMAVGASLPLTL